MQMENMREFEDCDKLQHESLAHDDLHLLLRVCSHMPELKNASNICNNIVWGCFPKTFFSAAGIGPNSN